MSEEFFEKEVGRRGFLLGSLASAITVTSGGLTGLVLSSGPSAAASKFVVNVMGSYSFTDAVTGCNVAVTVKNGIRRIVSNGIPNHKTGTFPNTGNPNTISAQKQDFSLSTSPKMGNLQAASMGAGAGVAINGVIFEPGTAEVFNNDPKSGWNIEAFNSFRNLGLDSSNAHVQPTGTYHYHGNPVGLSQLVTRSGHSPLIGWAADGFPMYLDRGYVKAKDAKSGYKTLKSSYQLKTGTRASGPGGTYNGDYTQDFEYVVGSGDLDAGNGRVQVTPEFPKGTYCYIITAGFPYIARQFRGTIASGFLKQGGPNGQQGGAQGGSQAGPQGGNPDLVAAAKKLGISEQTLRDALGPPPPNLVAAAQKLGITESALRAALGI